MTGPVEVDETFVGGKVRKRYSWTGRRTTQGTAAAAKRNSLSNKITVQGIVQRGGRVVAVTVANVRSAYRFCPTSRSSYCPPRRSTRTNCTPTRTLPKQGYKHDRVNHS